MRTDLDFESQGLQGKKTHVYKHPNNLLIICICLNLTEHDFNQFGRDAVDLL